MSFDAAIPRSFPSPNHYSIRGTLNQDSEYFPAHDPNYLPSPSDDLRTPHYVLQPGLNNSDAFAVTANHRVDTEPWTSLPLAQQPGTVGVQAQARTRQQGLTPVPVPHFQPGPKSDVNDEGYYTGSRQDVQSVCSTTSRNINEEPQNMYGNLCSRSVPSIHLESGPGHRNQEHSDQGAQYGSRMTHHVVGVQSVSDAFVCEAADCRFVGKTQSELKYISQRSTFAEPTLTICKEARGTT